MQHEFEVEVPDSQKYVSFTQNEIRYVIYHAVNLEEGEEIESHQYRLAKVVVVNGANRASGTNEVEESTNNYVTGRSSVLDVEAAFRLKVNEYFASLGGGSITFPEDGTNWEKYNWIMGTGYSFSNGVLSLDGV